MSNAPRLALMALLFAVGPVWQPARAADTGEAAAVLNRLERVERELRDLERDYYRNGSPPAQSGGSSGYADGGGDAGFSVRLTALEESLRSLTGQVEEMNFRMSQLDARVAAIEGTTKPPPGQSGQAPLRSPTVLGSASGDYQGPGADALPAEGATGATDKPPPNAGVENLGSYSIGPGGSSVPPPSPRQQVSPAAVTPAPVPKPLAGDADSQYAAAFDVLMRGDNESGAIALKSFVTQHPTSPKAGEAYYWLGEAQLAQKAYREAAEAFLTTVQKYPKDPKAPQAYVKLGVTLVQGGQKTEGCKQLKGVKTAFPKASQSVLDMAAREKTKADCK